MVIGAAVVRDEKLDSINGLVKELRSDKIRYELKWCELKRHRLHHFSKFIDLTFQLLRNRTMKFHCIVIDLNKYKNMSKGSDKELGFYKAYYQLLLHRFGLGLFDKNFERKFIIHLDRNEFKYPLSNLLNSLNNTMYREKRIKPFIHIEAIDSKEKEIIQMVDLIIGAISYQKNEWHTKSDAAKYKIDLLNYITNKSGLSSLMHSTIHEEEKEYGIGIWNFKT
jgi:hypothetical protein